MKKTSLLLITLLTSSGAANGAEIKFEDLFKVPPHVTDVTQSVVLNFQFRQTDGIHLCNSIVNVYPDHLDVIFHTCADGIVRKGWKGETETLQELRRLINEIRPDLMETPIKDFIYRP